MSWNSPQGPRGWAPQYGYGGSPNWGMPPQGFRPGFGGSPRQPRPPYGGWGPYTEVIFLIFNFLMQIAYLVYTKITYLLTIYLLTNYQIIKS